MKKSVTILLFINCILIAQNQDIAVGYIKSELQKNAIQFAADYVEKLQPKAELFVAGENYLLRFTPEFKILLGSKDAFNGILLKYSGNLMFFKMTTIAGIETPDLSKTFHNVPVSIGMETNQNFSYINGLLETGYVPWYQNNIDLPSFIKQTKLGIFLQGGYKFAISDSLINTGGAKDESNEKNDKGIFRIKIAGGFSPAFYFDDNNELGLALIGNGNAWYDFINKEIYYQLLGKLRLLLTKDYYLDFGYEKGSGAPNFNQGDQFSTNLGIVF